MKKLLLLVLTSTLSLPGQTAATSPEWKELNVKECNFAVEMPGVPKASPTATGQQWNLDAGHVYYRIFCMIDNDWQHDTRDPQKMLDHLVGVNADVMSGKVLKSEVSTFQGFPARYYEIQGKWFDDQRETTAHGRLYKVKQFTYLVEADVDLSGKTADGEKFLNSFRLLQKP